MRSIYRLNLRLRPSILVLFGMLTIPLFFGLIWLTYASNDQIARNHAGQLLERFRVVAIDNVEDEFAPVRSLIRAAAEVGNEYPDFYRGHRALKYFASMLLHSDKIVSVYAGLEDGSFRQARRIDPKVEILGELPPKEARYAYRLIEAAAVPPILDRYIFLDTDQRTLGTTGKPTDYDPRQRRWYRNAKATEGTLITDPDVFATLGLIGFTVTSSFRDDRGVLGVVAADFTLDGLSQYLAEHKVSPGSISYLLDHQGRVLAASDRSRSYSNVGGNVELVHVASLNSKLAAVAFGARPREHQELYSFNHKGKEYVASLSSLPPNFGKQWQLFVVTPLDDFAGAFRLNNNRLLLIGLIAISLEILIIYFLASIISRPLESLALKVGEIQQLSGRSLPPVQSPVREVAVLSRAIDTLDTALKSFSSFVPVGLVKQLLQSEQKLELGGHSRFLTIFFSDLEAFSTLSEEIPSQELLLRVSSYLELVTKAVNGEAGTIDKFVGDGVMAFWGAPALLEDHAWRACVAAMRVQRGMEVLNESWQRQGLKPLNMRVGVHCDAVLVGNIGSKERMSYTVMGDGVNVTSRLEAINKEYGTRICISHSVYKEAGDRLCVRPIDEVVVKGRRSRIPIYELLGVEGSDEDLRPSEDTVQLAALTRTAYEALMREDFATAADGYRTVLQQFAGDPVAQFHLDRLAAVRLDPARARGSVGRP